MRSEKARWAAIAGATAGVTLLHFATPAGPHDWHWLDLPGQKLF
jgi:hypothetical protein